MDLSAAANYTEGKAQTQKMFDEFLKLVGTNESIYDADELGAFQNFLRGVRTVVDEQIEMLKNTTNRMVDEGNVYGDFYTIEEQFKSYFAVDVDKFRKNYPVEFEREVYFENNFAVKIVGRDEMKNLVRGIIVNPDVYQKYECVNVTDVKHDCAEDIQSAVIITKSKSTGYAANENDI